MSDLNLLRARDALIGEASVAGAARRLGLSPSAMSRTLARAGRGLVLSVCRARSPSTVD